MTEQEAFDKWSLGLGVIISGRDLPVARQAFQAGRAYEAERVKKLVEVMADAIFDYRMNFSDGDLAAASAALAALEAIDAVNIKGGV